MLVAVWQAVLPLEARAPQLSWCVLGGGASAAGWVSCWQCKGSRPVELRIAPSFESHPVELRIAPSGAAGLAPWGCESHLVPSRVPWGCESHPVPTRTPWRCESCPVELRDASGWSRDYGFREFSDLETEKRRANEVKYEPDFRSFKGVFCDLRLCGGDSPLSPVAAD